MNFIFASTGEYPDNQAAAIRHSTLAKGLIELNHTITFLLLTPQNWEGKNELDYFGVKFYALNNYRGTNKIKYNIHKIKAVSKALKIINNKSKQHKIDALIIFTIDIIPIYFLMKKAHSIKIKVFHERTELPYVFSSNKIGFIIYLKMLLPKFDGIFVISDKLNKYIQKFNSNTQKLLTVVDLFFFKTPLSGPYLFPYIGYCGTIRGSKDGVPILVEAFAKLAITYTEIKLVLVGNNSDKNAIIETLDLINKFKINDKVIFTGSIAREMIPIILCNAKMLVVAKPDNEQNSGNFPIKIGEYLATGLPVVVTDVGEISHFLKDGETGFLAKPGSVDSFYEKMKEVLSNPIKAKRIGENGKNIAECFFDYKIQAKIMADYIAQINLIK